MKQVKQRMEKFKETPFRATLRLWLVVGTVMMVLSRVYQFGWSEDRAFMLVMLVMLGFLNAPDRNDD